MTTPNYGFALATDASQMSDVDTFLNNNFAIIENKAPAPIEMALPYSAATSPYAKGSRIYLDHTNPLLRGIYVCASSDAVWGYSWWPVDSYYSPWRRPGPLSTPNSVLIDPATYNINDSDAPLQFRLTNRGTVEFRGAVNKTTGTWVDTGSGGLALLKDLPIELAPQSRVTFGCSLYPINSTAANNHQWAQALIRSDGTNFHRIWNPNNTATRLFHAFGYQCSSFQ